MNDDKTFIGKLDKKSLSGFVDYDCQKQLYLSLGSADPRWVTREILIRKGKSDITQETLRLGKEYEASVYHRLTEFFADHVHFRGDLQNVQNTTLWPKILEEVYQKAQAQQHPQFLLEGSFEITSDFVRSVFGLSSDSEMPTLGNQSPRSNRPDILIFGNLPSDFQTAPLELCSNGETHPVSDLDVRIGISILDIKNSQKDRIGLRHYSELLFYAHALRAYLDQLESNGMKPLFYVRVNGHSIFGRTDLHSFGHDLAQIMWTNPKTVHAQQMLVAPMVWDDTKEIFTRFQRTVRDLYQQASTQPVLDTVDLKIQQKCARCPYIDDCTQQLSGCSPTEIDSSTAASWDLRLLPLLKSDIAKQIFEMADKLNEPSLKTIGGVNQHLTLLVDALGDVPTPLHAEIPSLKMRTQALLDNQVKVGSNGLLSMALPQQMNMALLFDIEMEDLHDIVFAFAVNLVMVAPRGKKLKHLANMHSRWWTAWASVINQGEPIDHVFQELPHNLLNPEPEKEMTEDALDAQNAQYEEDVNQQLQEMKESLLFLKKYGALTLEPSGIAQSGRQYGKKRTEPLVQFHVSNLSLGFEDKHEYGLLQSLIKVLYHIVIVCWTTERLTLALDGRDDEKERKRIVSQTFAGFYWSTRQVDSIRQLVERHLDRLQKDGVLFPLFNQLIEWMTPSDSRVQSFNFAKKMFDFEGFLKHGVAFPKIIAYSWHEIHAHYHPQFLSSEAQREIHYRFWIPHYNFMDFTVWYEFLNTDDAIEKDEYKSGIREQLALKMSSIQELLLSIHSQATKDFTIPLESQTIDTARFQSDSPNRLSMHPVATAWYAYSKLNASASQIEVDRFRMLWPELGMAKLRVGNLSDIAVVEDSDLTEPTRLQFMLKGLSSNMKVKVGDWVMILHKSCRDLAYHWWVPKYASKFTIESMVWDVNASGYLVTGFISLDNQASTKGLTEEEQAAFVNYSQWKELFYQGGEPDRSIFTLFKNLGKSGWYLYHTDNDSWSKKLLTALNRTGLGYSWLGGLLSIQHGLSDGSNVYVKDDGEVSAADLYMYAPSLLPQQPMSTSLQTTIKFAPDSSQQEAILRSLSLPISCIQGPPGTGKSQTIVALLDDFILRFKAKHNRLPKILVSAFSYTALEVVLEKILASRTGEGSKPNPDTPSDVATMPIMLATSQHRDQDFTGLELHPSQHQPIHLQYSSGWNIVEKTMTTEGCVKTIHPIRFGKKVRDVDGTSKMRLFGRILDHRGLSSFEVNPFVEPLKENGKAKSPTAITNEQKAIRNQQIKDSDEQGFILFANSHSLCHLGKRNKKGAFNHLNVDFGFDLIVVDEASQMPTSHFIPIADFIKPFSATLDVSETETFQSKDEEGNSIQHTCATQYSEVSLQSVVPSDCTQIVLVGDQEQLPPIQQIKPSEKLHPLTDSVFRYFLDVHGVPNTELSHNYRSHKDIVRCIQELGIYGELTAFRQDDWLDDFPDQIPSSVQTDWIRHLLQKEQVVSTLTHAGQWDTSLSDFEAELTAQIVVAFYQTVAPPTPEAEVEFWQEEIGVVAPHNAHGSLVSRKIFDRMSGFSHLSGDKLKEMLDTSIYSVEKFQGSDRSFIIGTVGVSSQDQLMSEQEFLYDLNRFNVLISRAKHKMLFICSENYLRFVPTETKVMGVASKVRHYAQNLCNREQVYHVFNPSTGNTEDIHLRWMEE